MLDRGDCAESSSNEETISGHQGTSYPLPVLEDGATVTFNTNEHLSSGLDEAVGRQHQEVDSVVALTEKTMLKQASAMEDHLKMSTSAQLKIGEAEMDRAGIEHSLDPQLKLGDPSSSSSSITDSGSTSNPGFPSNSDPPQVRPLAQPLRPMAIHLLTQTRPPAPHRIPACAMRQPLAQTSVPTAHPHHRQPNLLH